jgi:RNA polymerase sigma factor (sigma-70 family)
MNSTTPVTGSTSVEVLYREHHHWLQGWLRKKLGDTHQAADLTHDTFVRVMGSEQVNHPIHEPRAFLTTLAQRVLYTFWRRRELEQAWLQVLASQPEELAISAEDYACVREAVEAIDRLLKGLPAKVRQAFLLRTLDEMTHAEIASTMQISIASVERYLKQAFVHCYLARHLLDPNT